MNIHVCIDLGWREIGPRVPVWRAPVSVAATLAARRCVRVCVFCGVDTQPNSDPQVH